MEIMEQPREQSLLSAFLYSLMTAFSLFVLGYWLFPIFKNVFRVILPFIPTEGGAQAAAEATAVTFWVVAKYVLIAFIFISSIYWIIWLLRRNTAEAFQ